MGIPADCQPTRQMHRKSTVLANDHGMIYTWASSLAEPTRPCRSLSLPRAFEACYTSRSGGPIPMFAPDTGLRNLPHPAVLHCQSMRGVTVTAGSWARQTTRDICTLPRECNDSSGQCLSKIRLAAAQDVYLGVRSRRGRMCAWGCHLFGCDF